MQKLNMNFDGALHRITARLGVGHAALGVAMLPTNGLPHVQVNAKKTAVRVAYTTASRDAIDVAIASAEAEVAASAGTAADVFAILTAAGEDTAFITWSLGDVLADTNKSDYFEAPISGLLFLCDVPAEPTADSTASITIVQ